MVKPKAAIDWERVFDLRCKAKRGQGLTETEQALCGAAHKSDPARYSGMNAAIFEATHPLPK